MRTFGIWLFGLLASAIVGGMVGNKMGSDGNVLGDPSAVFGMLAGMFAFACLRLWLGESR